MDLNTIFENAIKQGMTSPDDWMYMYSNDEKDFFKNCYSREYISFRRRKKAMSEDEKLHEHIKLLTDLAFCVNRGHLKIVVSKEENNE